MKITVVQSRAFTLLELMATLAIVLIITMLAYPSLDKYVVRSKVTDAIGAAAEIQTMIAAQIASNETVTGSGTSISSFATISRYVSAYSVSANGVISITTTADAGSISLTLSPNYDAILEQVSWVCAVSSSSQDDYVPSSCRI